MASKRKGVKINSKTKTRLMSILDWLASLVLMLVALIFIFSSQVFQENQLQAWANVFTTVGTAMLSLVSLHMGSRLQQTKDRKNERRITRKTEVNIHRKYLQEVSNLVEQLKRAEYYEHAGEQDKSDLIRIHVQEKLELIQRDRPSVQNISEEHFRCNIGSAMEHVVQLCDAQISDSGNWNELEKTTQMAFSEIVKYENIE